MPIEGTSARQSRPSANKFRGLDLDLPKSRTIPLSDTAGVSRPVQTEQPQMLIPFMDSFVHGLLNATASFSEAFGPQHRNKAWQAKSRIPLLHQVTGWR